MKPSYPGVYIQEVPSGVRTIRGVSTSVAAFVGWAPRGPADVPVRCLSWTDFERVFGGLDTRGLLGYAVQQFFLNGGLECFVIRLAGPGDKAATATLDGLEVQAKGPGTWSHFYLLVATPKADDPERFRLDIVDEAIDAIVESHADLALDPTDRRSAEKVLEASHILKVTKADETRPVTAKTIAFAGGEDGEPLAPGDSEFDEALFGDEATTGVFALKTVLFNLLNVPGYTDAAKLAVLAKMCRDERAFLLVDSDKGTEPGGPRMTGGPDSRLTGDDGINAAYYYPWIMMRDPKQSGSPRAFPPGGAVAGLFARTDATRGVWKAPAGTDASLNGVFDVTVPTTDRESGVLNPLAVNCIRRFPGKGILVWGARTLRGSDGAGSDWKYVPVRRTALFIEESLYRGLQWVVFEPNDEPLWAQIRLNVGAFMHGLFRQGAFQGTSPREAYFVKCDRETTTQNDINLNIVNIIVGFAPLKPAEFVIIKIRQLAGQQAA